MQHLEDQKQHMSQQGNFSIQRESILKICITNLYPTGSPFIHAWKAESTASKCKNIRRPVRLQIIGCINKYIESDCYTFCGSLGASLSSYYKLATISNTILAMVEELHTREDITYCRTTTCYLDAKIYSLSTSKLKQKISFNRILAHALMSFV